MTSIPFTVNTTNKGLWRTLANNEYEDSMQPITEIIDNSLAAESTVIKITVNFETNRGSIEDNGKGFPVTPEELSRCFTYSPDKRVQTNLNEHGCGLKSSLAILDPHDESWRITWKNINIYQVTAPYSSMTHSATQINEWPGSIDDKTGSLIEFPIQKKQFGSIYSKKGTSMTNVIPKLKEELSQYWMRYPKFVNGIIKMYLNDEQVVPFVIPHDDTNYVSSVKNFSCLLSSGAKLEGSHYVIAQHIPNSWFRKTITANGIYLFKNGRMIQKVTSGSLYKQITQLDVNTTLNGNIAVVNVYGDQKDLPITVPTKNKFKPSHNPLFDEVIKILQKEIKFEATLEKYVSEESLLAKFEKTRSDAFGSEEDIDYKFILKEQFKFNEDNLNSPQLDAIEIINKKAIVYEAKRENKVALQHINQLYCNWILSIDAIREMYITVDKVIPILIINSDKESHVLSEGLKIKIKKLNENSKIGFPIEIRNYENAELYKFK
jgi:hypothetical protein